MPTSYQDQFYVMDPASPPPSGFTLVPGYFEFIDENDDGFIGVGDTLNGETIDQVWPYDVISVDDPVTGATYQIVGVTFNTGTSPGDPFGTPYFTPLDGTVLTAAEFGNTVQLSPAQQPIPVAAFLPPCFTTGTLIDTVDGTRAVETLQPGDLVRTADEGMQSLLEIERRTFSAQGKYAPVLIRKGALGNTRDLRVSQEHRMLITGWRAEMATGSHEVLVAAKHLVNGNDIVIEEGKTVEYIHLLFDRHQIVFAEGIASESYLPAFAVDRAEAGVNRETLDLFPDLVRKSAGFAKAVRPVAKRREALLLRDAA